MSAAPPRILLLGGNGQLGRALRTPLSSLGRLGVASRDGVLAEGGAGIALDLERPETLRAAVRDWAPDIVVNAAAYTAVDRAEDEPDRAFAVNAMAPAALAEACRDAGAWLVHYSTDYVFDGTATRPWREDDTPHPLGVYGASKLAGETAIRASGARHVILRTAWVYASHGRNFLLTMLRLAGERDELRVVADQVGAPTPAAWIADATAEIVRRGVVASGTWHLVADGETSWHGFAEAIVDDAHALGSIARKPRVVAIPTADYPTPARRPAYSVLDTTRLQRDFGVAPPDWRDGLRRTLAARS